MIFEVTSFGILKGGGRSNTWPPLKASIVTASSFFVLCTCRRDKGEADIQSTGCESPLTELTQAKIMLAAQTELHRPGKASLSG